MKRKKKRKKSPTTETESATVSFRISVDVAEFLNEQAQENKDGTSKPSRHKEARRIFAHGLKELYGIDLA